MSANRNIVVDIRFYELINHMGVSGDMQIRFSDKKKEHLHKLLFMSIIMIACILRFSGIGWGLPNTNLHPDEALIFYPAYQNTLNHSFEVRSYERPSHVSIKVNTLLYVGIQELYFVPKDKLDFTANFNEYNSLFITASRMMTAIFSMITVIFAYLIGRFYGKKQALLAALLFALFPPFIEHSHYITPDIPLLCFLMGVLWAGLWYLHKPKLFPLALMSLFTAFAICEKYPGAYGCVMIAVVLCIAHIKRPMLIIGRGFLSIVLLLLSMMSISPVLLVDLRSVIEVVKGQNHLYHLGADGLDFTQTVFFYLENTVINLGFVLTFCCIYSLLRQLGKDIKKAIVFISFLLYIIPISTLSIHWERYTLPIYAVGLLFAAIGFFYILEDLKTLLLKLLKNNSSVYKNIENNGVLSWLIATVIFVLPVCSLLASSIAVVGSFLVPDNRISLQQTFADLNINTGNTIYDCNTPLDPGGYYGVFSSFEAGDPEQYKYGERPKYIMTSSAQRDLYIASDPEVYGWIAKFYLKLDELYPLVCLYTPEIPSRQFFEIQNISGSIKTIVRYLEGATVGYEIRVYQLQQ